jgi:hypothetical protein
MKIIRAIAERIEHRWRHDDRRGEADEPAARKQSARKIVA